MEIIKNWKNFDLQLLMPIAKRLCTYIFIYIAILLFIFVFIYSLLGMQIYGSEDPKYFSSGRTDFFTFFDAFISVF